MARKITSGIVGRAVLGTLTTNNNSLQSVVTNANVLLEPNGTGIVQSTRDLQINAQNSLRLADGDSSNWIALRSPATVSSNVTLTFPSTAGTSAQVLTTDGTGTLSWVAASIAVSNQTADVATYYPTITTATSGTVNTISTSSSRLSYVPSTGTLSSTEMRVTASTTSSSGTTGALVVTGGVGVGGTVRLGNNTASTTTSTGALVVTGGVGIGGQMTAASIVETSSITLKENITPIENALESILKLSGVTYDRIDNKEHEAGLIAEWTAKILPDLVTTDADGNAVGIKYTKLTAYLIESIKTLKQEIEQLKGR